MVTNEQEKSTVFSVKKTSETMPEVTPTARDAEVAMDRANEVVLLDAEFLASLAGVNPDVVQEHFNFEPDPSTQSGPTPAANVIPASNPDQHQQSPDVSAQSATQPVAAPGANNGWQCAICTTRNPPHHSVCSVCYSDRPAGQQSTPASEQGGPPVVGMEIRCKPPGIKYESLEQN